MTEKYFLVLSLYNLFALPHLNRMDSLLIILMAIAMMATLVVLIIGMSGMVIGGEFNKKYGNKLMSARVILQGISIFLLALVILTQHHT